MDVSESRRFRLDFVQEKLQVRKPQLHEANVLTLNCLAINLSEKWNKKKKENKHGTLI